MLVCGGLALFRRESRTGWLVRPLSNGFENQAEAARGGGAAPELVLTGDCQPRRWIGAEVDCSGIRLRSSLFERECCPRRNLVGVPSPLLWRERSGDCPCVCPCV